MSADDTTGQRPEAKKLAFVLSQLRDDLGEIVDQLDDGELDVSAAKAAASLQMRVVLAQLADGNEN